MITSKTIDSHQKEIAEAQISEARKAISYNTVDFMLEHFVYKISDEEIEENLHWDKLQQSYFIESLLLGLPVIHAVISNDKELELIDGKQRLYTAISFIKGNLKLRNLKTLKSLNGFKFSDLVRSRQIKFQKILVRTIQVAPNSDESIWREYR